MADHFYGIDKGQNEHQAVNDTVTNATDMELRFDTAIFNEMEREDAIAHLVNYIRRLPYPPA